MTKPNNTAISGAPITKHAHTAGVLFIVAFVSTMTVALFVQLVLLPYFFPHLHAGHGMLIGSDSSGMNEAAALLAERIRSEGWWVWELRPASGNAPTGIAAALYVYFVAEPFVLVPLNAFVHAASGVIIYLIAFSLSQKRLASVLAALPFLVLPSAAIWYAQIHKDGIFALGIFLCALGWSQVFKREFWCASAPRYAALLLPIFFGLLLVWVVRPQIMVLMQVMAIFNALFGLVAIGVWWRSGRLLVFRALKAIFVLLAIPVAMLIVKPSDYRVESWKSDVVKRESTMRYMPTSCVVSRGDNTLADKLSSTVATMRDFFISGYPNAKSNMDPDFVPGTVCNLLTYFPRALQIGFLAPFPSEWTRDGSNSAGTMMRRVLSAEMLAIYAGLLFLPLAIWRYYRKPEFWFIIVFFTSLTLIHVYLIPNMGTLHRMRYGFLTIIVGVAISSLFSFKNHSNRNKTSNLENS